MNDSCYVIMLNDLNEEVEFTVDYSYSVEKDPYGTGDVPTKYTVDEFTVSHQGGDVTSFLSPSTLDYVEWKIHDDIQPF